MGKLRLVGTRAGAGLKSNLRIRKAELDRSGGSWESVG